MSSSDVLVPCNVIKQSNSNSKESSEKEMRTSGNLSSKMQVEVSNGHPEEEIEPEEKQSKGKKVLIHVYDKDTLIVLRSAAASLKKPECFNDEFMKDGLWDPELWHKSKSSRSASPLVDGKMVIDGKRIDLLDDNIELAPHRRSFKQGCHVQTTHHHSHHNDGEKINLPNPPRSSYEKKSGRLTGRAVNLRRSMEKDYNDGFYDKSSKHGNKENRYSGDKSDRFFDRDRYNRDNRDDYHHHRDYRKDKRDNERSSGGRERHNSYRSNRHDSESSYKEMGKHDGENKGGQDHGKLPEWMIDGPTSQLDTMEFTGFQDIEEEKKAYAKRKKKVRISPDVVTQQIKIEEQKVEEKSQEKDKTSSQKPKSPVEEVKNVEDTDAVPTTNASKPSFNINEFFNEVDYYPPHMFEQDLAQSDGVRSRFTQWFQSQASRSSSRSGSVISNISRPGSTGIIPDEVITGVPPPPAKSPSTPYFTPIQPAPALVAAAANAHVIQTSNILNIIQRNNNKADEVTKTEVKGRITVGKLEEERKKDEAHKENEIRQFNTLHDSASQSAFEMFVQSMKDAGQLPEKPSPVVTGLPDHLLPKPPTRASPAFQKLKRSLSRSPSPIEFMKAVSTISSIIASNPTIDGELSAVKRPNQGAEAIKPMAPSEFFSQTADASTLKTPFSSHKGNASMQASSEDHNVSNSNIEDIADESSFNISVEAEQKKIPKGFLPTSVLKKMHNEKRSSPIPTSQNQGPDVSLIHIPNNSHPDLLSETVRATKGSLMSSTDGSMEHLNVKYKQLNVTPERSMKYLHHNEESLPFHSAPATPRQTLYPISAVITHHSVSAPGTPEHRLQNDPPHVQRLSAFTSPRGKESQLLVPSAFQANMKSASNKNDVGVIGSGKPNIESELKTASQFVRNEQTRIPPSNSLDQRLVPGSGTVHSNMSVNSNLAPGHLLKSPFPSTLGYPVKSHHQSTPMPSKHQAQPLSQQQQLLEAQRMAQIHQAQLLQQQKLQQIASEANQKLLQQQKQNGLTGAIGVKPLLPDPDTSTLQSNQRGEQQARPYQQQQHQQIQAFYQQQQQIQQQTRSQPNNFSSKPFQSQGQMPSGVPQVPLPMRQQQQPQNAGYNQIHNLNRPHGMQNVNLAAQALVRQQLFNQAARARFIAQAQLLQQQPQVMQAALMAQAALVRGQVQAQAAFMLNQMNMRQQNSSSVSSSKLPNTMINSKGDLQQMQGLSSTGNSGLGAVGSTHDNPLSKWFDKDVLQQIPSKGSSQIPSGKVLSVEELENKQR